MDTMIATLLERLAATSLHTLVLAAVVWGLCRWLPRLSAASQCWLWWLVGLQAVLGLAVGRMELPWLPAAAPPAMPALDLPASGVAIVAVQAPQVAAPLWPIAIAALWAAGVLVMAVGTLRGWREARALVRSARPCTDASLTQALALACEAHGLRRAPVLRISAQIASPQLVGALRPTLLLPDQTALDSDELDMALTHELVHLRRGDLWLGWVPTLARHLLFFHPLVHLAVREYGIAREAACDAAVVAGDHRCRHGYGRLLVRLGVTPGRPACLASASPTFLSLKRRLTMLQTTHSSSRLGASLLLLGVAVAGVLPLRLVAAPAASAVPPVPAAAATPTRPVLPVAPSAPATPARPAISAAAAAALSPAEIAEIATSAAQAAEAALSSAEIAEITAAATSEALAAAAPAIASSVASATTSGTRQVQISGRTPQAYVRTRGGADFVMSGSTDDFEAARRQTGGGDALWLRRGNDRYLIRDPATLRRFDTLLEPVTRLGREQSELGTQQGRLGGEQGRLGAEQGVLGQRQARLATAATQRALAGDGDVPASDQRDLDEIAARQRDLAERQRALGQQQAELGRRQGALGERQAEASRQIEAALPRLLDDALAAGKAQRL
ncbi:M56 family metallopeptidase [Luteimonas sp. TWI1416]|uniref:M56 family metallopeptidase n=1 Tax=unclassified Luteimonas TaxID=2629088 RepID=UPI003209625B